MDPKYVMTCILAMTLVMGIATSDIEKDREECANELVGLAACLSYVGGDAKAPTLDCCNGLKQVLKTTKKCLCILVNDRNDPSLGLKINATLALGLPTACNVPSNISECLALLNLAPNSPDAKVFEDFVNSSKGSNTTTSPTASGNNSTNNGSSAEVKSEGGKKKKWMIVEMVCIVMTSIVVHTVLNL